MQYFLLIILHNINILLGECRMTVHAHGKDIVVFGGGSLGIKVIKEFNKDGNYNVCAILDNDPEKNGTFLEGVPVQSPRNFVLEENKIIVIASMYSVEIQKQLNRMGIYYGTGYINFNEIFPFIEGVPMKFSAKLEELEFLGPVWNYSVDSVGILIRQDNEIYRAIYKHSMIHTMDILSILHKENFYGNRVILAEVTTLSADNFPLILHHPFIPVCSDVRSWSYTMRLQAMKFIFELLNDLKKDGLTFKDCHSFNLTYTGTNFLWVDFGSLIKGSLNVKVLQEWVTHFVFPLILMSKLSNTEYLPHILNAGAPYFMIKLFLDRDGILIMDEIFKDEDKSDSHALLQRVKEWITHYVEATPLEKKTMWSNYQDTHVIVSNVSTGADVKLQVIRKFLAQIKGKTLIDIAGNNGFYCIEAHKNYGYTGVLTDYDDQCIDLAFNQFQENNIKFIPLVNNFNYFPDNLTFRKEIIQFDTTLFLAFIHHLVFSNGFTFERVRDTLAKVTRKNLIIEFVDRNDEYVSTWLNPLFDWYDCNNFEKVFSETFSIEVKEKISDSRIIYLMKKNS